MKHRDRDDTYLHELAQEALDDEILRDLLETVSIEGYENQAVEALRQVVTDDLVRYLLASSSRARRRAGVLTAEHIGDVADDRGGCCCGDTGGRSDDEVHTAVAYFTKIDD